MSFSSTKSDNKIQASIIIRNIKFYYELEGKGEPVVLISGLKADHTSWATLTPELTKQYQVLTLDNRGIGNTKDDGEDFTIENMADDVIALFRNLKLHKPHIVGHSMGGAIAQVIAAQCPNEISSVTLCNTFIKFNKDAKAFFSKTVGKLYDQGKSQGAIMEVIIPWVFDPSFISNELISMIKEMSDKNDNPQSATDYHRQCMALGLFDSSKWVSTIKVPTLIIGSKADKTATFSESEALHKAISRSQLVALSGGHASAVEQPQPFIEALNGFWKSLSQTPSIKEEKKDSMIMKV